jgi:NADH-quinone oxidoreductase subunit E
MWIADPEAGQMLSQEEIREIKDQIRLYRQKRGACLEALSIVQRNRGWVSDESLKELAALLEMTPAELDSVATFYSLIFRRPVGRHVILICDSVTCWIMGYENLLDHLKARLGVGLGGTTEDGRFTLLPVTCLGACDHAPAMMIGDELYTDLTAEKLDEILARYE